MLNFIKPNLLKIVLTIFFLILFVVTFIFGYNSFSGDNIQYSIFSVLIYFYYPIIFLILGIIWLFRGAIDSWSILAPLVSGAIIIIALLYFWLLACLVDLIVKKIKK